MMLTPSMNFLQSLADESGWRPAKDDYVCKCDEKWHVGIWQERNVGPKAITISRI
jgi:hypothetical protein